MVIAPIRQRLIVALAAFSVAMLAVWALSASSVSAAGSDDLLAEPPVVDRAGDEESDDPFHVSDESLAVAIFIPGIFLLATGATVAWAISARRRDDEDDDDG